MASNQYLQPFFDSLSQGVQVAQHLATAARQAREFAQTQTLARSQQALREQEFQASQQQGLGTALQNGAQPVSDSGQVPLATPLPRPSAVTDAAGNMTVDPGTTNPQTSVAGNPNRQYEIGGQTLQAPTLQDQVSREIATQRAMEDARRVPLPPKIAAALGFAPGDPAASFTPEHAQGLGMLLHYANPAQTDNTVTPWKSEIRTDDAGKQTNFVTMTDGSVKEMPLKTPGKTDKFDAANATASATEGQTKALTENQRSESANKALKDYQTLLAQKNQITTENNNIGIALKTGEHSVDKDGHLTAFDKGAGSIPDDAKPGYQDAMRARLAANQARLPQVISDMQGAQNRYADLSGNNGARPQGAVAQPKAAPPKVASMANIDAYVAKFKVTRAQAIAAAKSDGYTIASQ